MCMYCDRSIKNVKLTESEIEIEFKAALPRAAKDDKIEKAYIALTKAYCKKDVDRSELTWAVEEAIGYLGEVLE